MAFYDFRQNNSYGSWNISRTEGISVHVIIEAESEYEAKGKAIALGLYFDGVDMGRDCGCCGDRWTVPWYPDDVPSIYGEPVHSEDFSISYPWARTDPEAFIHYADGRVEAVWSNSDGKTLITPYAL